jgi:hypothetical protein
LDIYVIVHQGRYTIEEGEYGFVLLYWSLDTCTIWRYRRLLFLFVLDVSEPPVVWDYIWNFEKESCKYFPWIFRILDITSEIFCNFFFVNEIFVILQLQICVIYFKLILFSIAILFEMNFSMGRLPNNFRNSNHVYLNLGLRIDPRYDSKLI